MPLYVAGVEHPASGEEEKGEDGAEAQAQLRCVESAGQLLWE